MSIATEFRMAAQRQAEEAERARANELEQANVHSNQEGSGQSRGLAQRAVQPRSTFVEHRLRTTMTHGASHVNHSATRTSRAPASQDPEVVQQAHATGAGRCSQPRSRSNSPAHSNRIPTMANRPPSRGPTTVGESQTRNHRGKGPAVPPSKKNSK